MNLVQPILAHARTRPDALALAQDDRRLSYRELASEVLRTAGHMIARGVRPMDRVGICLKDTIDHVVTLLAAARIGATPAPIDWRARPAEKMRAVTAFAPRLILVESDEEHLADPAVTPVDSAWHSDVGRATPPDDLPDDWNAPFVIISTSGTTGAPKYGIQTHLQFYFCIAARIELLPLPRYCRYLATLPLNFANGRQNCLTHLLRGDSLFLCSPRVSARDFIELVARHDANVAHVLPAILRQLLEIAEADRPLLPMLDLLVSAGAPLLMDEKRALLRKVTPNFYEEYGTGMTGILTAIRPENMAERGGSVGQPHSMVAIEIVDDAGASLPPGEVGRLRCRGPGVGSGISGGSATEAAAEGFHDGWYYTGEWAALDEQAFVFLKGRSAEIIFRGGAKVFPVEVESVLQQHPAVAEAAVVGRRLADGDQAVVAFVVVRLPVEASELLGHCRTWLTAYKTPREIRFVAEMPKSPIGKIDKRALAEKLDL
ncbi:MAG TPA: class I adenylate-forming enzyme family protein [Stellaceae bacterium]|nr:class I adenylate-forming enzyme family protein [Stellaceae bacterium]